MKVYRLVNCKTDSIEVGTTLSRASDHSNQKLGKGMYFAATYDDACLFAKIRHKYSYTHLLTCRLKGMTLADFVDLRKNPNLIIQSDFGKLPREERVPAYCKKYDKKGVIWMPQRGGWTEVLLLTEHIQDAVVIECVETLPT